MDSCPHRHDCRVHSSPREAPTPWWNEPLPYHPLHKGLVFERRINRCRHGVSSTDWRSGGVLGKGGPSPCEPARSISLAKRRAFHPPIEGKHRLGPTRSLFLLVQTFSALTTTRKAF